MNKQTDEGKPDRSAVEKVKDMWKNHKGQCERAREGTVHVS